MLSSRSWMRRPKPFVRLARLPAVLVAALAACSVAPPTTSPSDEVEIPPTGLITLPSRRVDDHAASVDATNVGTKRDALIAYLWGDTGFPTGLPATVEPDIPSPVADLINLRRVDRLRFEMDGERNLAHHYVAEHSNGRVVVFASGHVCTFADRPEKATSDAGYGQGRALAALLASGFSVITTFMPHMTPEVCDPTHGNVLDITPTSGHAMKWFVEPIARALNYVTQPHPDADFPNYRDISMIGLSGGGWTTALYAAIDPRVRTSLSVAGSLPIYLRQGASIGDKEQTLPELYDIAGYLDLYTLGAAGIGRRQIHVLNRDDNCCFGELQWDSAQYGPWDDAVRGVENLVQTRLASMGESAGDFRLDIDEVPDHHTISWNTLVGTLLAELEGALSRVGSSDPNQAFIRHLGTIWRWRDGVWTDTHLRAAGRPTVVEDAEGEVELYYRSPSNWLMRASPDGDGWQETSLGARIVVEPVAVRSGEHTVVAAIGTGYNAVLATWPGGLVTSTQAVGVRSALVGVPALVAHDGSVEMFVRAIDGQLRQLTRSTLDAPWACTVLGGSILQFPAAVRSDDGSERVYVRTLSGFLEISRAAPDGVWQWTAIDGRPIWAGSPAVDAGATPAVTMRDQSGVLHRFTVKPSGWQARPLHARISDTPVAAGRTLFGFDAMGRLRRSVGPILEVLGKP